MNLFKHTLDAVALLRAELGSHEVPHARIREVAADMGVPYTTLRKLARGWIKTPNYMTHLKLLHYYGERLGRKRAPKRGAPTRREPPAVRPQAS